MPPKEPAWAAVVVNYEAGDLLTALCHVVARRRLRRSARDRGGRQRIARRLGLPSAGRARRRRGRRAGPQPRVRGRGQHRHRGDIRARRGGVQSRPRSRAGRRGDRARALRRRARPRGAGAADREPRRHAVPLRPSRSRASSTPSVTRCWAWSRRATGSPAATANSTPTPAWPRDVDWVSGAMVFLRRAAFDLGGWLGRAVLHVLRGSRPLLAAATARLAGRGTSRGPRRPPPGGQHLPGSLPDDRRAPPLRVPLRVPGGGTAPAVCSSCPRPSC